MRRSSVLLSTCAVICLSWPAGSLAAPPGDRGSSGAQADQGNPQSNKGKKNQKGDNGPAKSKQKSAPAAAARPGRVKGGSGSPAEQQNASSRANVRAQRGQRQSQGQSQRQSRDSVRAPAAPAKPPQRATARTYQPAPRARQAPQARPASGTLSAWRAPARGPERDRVTQQWRQQNQGWDSGAVWRQSPTWWRSDSGFHLFVGPRIGFYFVPLRGYVAVPRQYRDRHWREGEYLPTWFRAYVVSDYRHYGLPHPPRNCVWIWLNGDVALIDRSDGYILDIEHNVW